MLAAVTGIGPAALADLDGRMFAALEEASAKRWDAGLELQAATLETLHELLRSFVAVHSAKGAQLPDRLVVPRPGTPAEPAAPAALTLSQFASLHAGVVVGVESGV